MAILSNGTTEINFRAERPTFEPEDELEVEEIDSEEIVLEFKSGGDVQIGPGELRIQEGNGDVEFLEEDTLMAGYE